MIKDSLEEMGKAVMALFLELPESIAKDVKAKYDNLYDDIKDSLIEWHKVEDELPTEEGYYDVYYATLKPKQIKPSARIDRHYFYGGMWYLDDGEAITDEPKPTHWFEVKPPKE